MMPECPDNSNSSSVTLNLRTNNNSCSPPTTMTTTTSSSHKSVPNLNGSGGGGGGGGGGNLSPHSRCSSNDSPSPPSLSSSRIVVTAAVNGVTTTGTNSNNSNNNNNNGGQGLMISGGGGLNGGRNRDLQTTTCGSRQLSKVKRFLTTLQQFGSDISTEAGERVRNLILNLVNGNLAIDEFHLKLQETTNFPLRPFVIPFLKTNLPLLQREILHCARLAKLSPQQYLHQHEHLVLDPSHSSSEPIEIFHHSSSSSDLNENGKRRSSTESRLKENGSVDTLLDIGPPLKRHHPLLSPPLSVHPTSTSSLGLHQSLNFRLEDYGLAREFRERDRMSLDREYRHYVYSPRDILDDKETEEEWKNIHTMLNCILGMVEKTKRALAILQHRSQSDRHELAMWVRRHTEGTENNLKKQAGDMMAQTLKTTEDRVSEVRRRAEEAVNEVKRQAVVELQKAVSAAEVKARELVASERGKMEKLIMEARRQATDEALVALNQQADSNETCWNCGRKANETCSGCNIARYCGSFCQHKDWENHHHVCGQGQSSTSTSVTSTSTAAIGSSSSSSSSTSITSGTLTSRGAILATNIANSTNSSNSSPLLVSALSRSISRTSSRSSTPVDLKTEPKH